MKLASYPFYRTSQIDWVGKVPVDWEECSAKINYLMQLGKMLQNDPAGLEDVEITYLKAQHVNWNRVTTEDLPRMWASPSDLEQYGVLNGDLLVCEGGEVGRAAILKGLEESAIIQNALHRVRGTERGDVRYFAYLLKHIADAGWFAILCNKATIAHLTGDKLGAIYMPVPTIPEQQQIAAFLDWKTEQIDALIARKKELLEKLKEKRLAVITQAVTKGLNNAAPTRDSGISWLEKVPQHWEVKRLKFIFPRLYSGVSVNSDNTPSLDGSTAILKTSSVYGNRFKPEENKRVVEDELDRVTCPVTQDSLIISRMNTPELVGNCGYVDRDYDNLFLPDRLWIARFLNHSEAHGKFAWYLVTSHQLVSLTGILATGTSDSMKNLTQEAFLNIPVGLPPYTEQVEIASRLDIETARLDLLDEKVTAAIDRLTEYRTALITAATTGKIDVRKVKIPDAKPALRNGR